MIIANGTIETKIKTGGGIDPDTDYPIAPSVSWATLSSANTEQINTATKARQTAKHLTIASYEILIDEQPYNAEMLRLRDISGKILGRILRHRSRAVTGSMSNPDLGLIWEQNR